MTCRRCLVAALFVLLATSLIGCANARPEAAASVPPAAALEDAFTLNQGGGKAWQVSMHASTETPAECRSQLRTFFERMWLLTKVWDGSSKVASRTPRAEIAPRIERLREVQYLTTTVAVPECASAAKLALEEAMAHTISGYEAFQRDEPEVKVNAAFAAANAAMTEFSGQMEFLRALAK
jgi:hypothetical protein